MGNRLSKIVTKTGDSGKTGLGDGSRISKHASRIHALGEIDELNSSLGVLLCEELPESVSSALLNIQHDLFDLGGELCLPEQHFMLQTQVSRLEDLSTQWNANLPRLKEFVLPGGVRSAALAHLARAVCRRAERRLVELSEATDEAVNPITLCYINRLSDFLFILGRMLNQESNHTDSLWEKGKGR